MNKWCRRETNIQDLEELTKVYDLYGKNVGHNTKLLPELSSAK